METAALDGRAFAFSFHGGQFLLMRGPSERAAPSRAADPAALAALLRQACRAKLAGRPPRASTASVAEMGGHDLATETRFFVDVARAYAATASTPDAADRVTAH
ncbi:DUF6545 domain-containing protein [Streptomyces sp. NPDC020096]